MIDFKFFAPISGLLALMCVILPAHNLGAEELGQSKIAALYETRVIQISHRPKSQNNQWRLWRSDDLVAREVGDQSIERWHRASNGEIAYDRIFPQEKRVIEYVPGDLRALQSYPDWLEVTQLISADQLNRLRRLENIQTAVGEAEHYQGQIGGVDWEVHWLPEVKLPAMVRTVNGARETSIHLLEIHPLANAPWPVPSSRGYEAIDYADLGDNEADPFVQRHAQHGHHEH